MKSITLHWLATLKPLLGSAQLPLWDPEWLRRRYRRLAESPF